MNFSFFPKYEYWLSSPLSPDAVSEFIHKDIVDNRNKGFVELVDEFADNTTRTFRYFNGTVSKIFST